MADPDSRLRIAIVDATGRPTRAPGVGSWLQRVAPRKASGDLTIALVSDAQIRALNKRYRKKDRFTDVLSFPGEGSHLGDIAIARGVAEGQARRAGHSLRTELRVLALHGLLHLIGYDHERDSGQMRRLEIRLRRKGGLHEGLIERAT